LFEHTRHTSNAHSISQLEVAEETWVRHLDALKRHKHSHGKGFNLDAPLFSAPQTRSWKRAVKRVRVFYIVMRPCYRWLAFSCGATSLVQSPLPLADLNHI